MLNIIFKKSFVRNSWKIESRWRGCGGGVVGDRRPESRRRGARQSGLGLREAVGERVRKWRRAWDYVDESSVRTNPPCCRCCCWLSGRRNGGGGGGAEAEALAGSEGSGSRSGKNPGARVRPSRETLLNRGRADFSKNRRHRRLWRCSHPLISFPSSPPSPFCIHRTIDNS